MKLLRAFIAIEIPPDIRSRIHQEVTALKKVIGDQSVRWVAANNVHLTLKFLGDVSPANLDLLKQSIQHEAGEQPPFDVTIQTLGCFPNPRRPRVIWIGMSAPAVLDNLQRGIDLATARLGYASEERPFSPHLTIGRISQHASPEQVQTIRTTLEQSLVNRLGTARVTEVCLFQSELRPTGAEYTPLFHALLGK